MYSQHVQPQAQYGSPVYMQQVYSPQQQYPVYPVVSPSWNPSLMPYFETPLVRTSVYCSECLLKNRNVYILFDQKNVGLTPSKFNCVKVVIAVSVAVSILSVSTYRCIVHIFLELSNFISYCCCDIQAPFPNGGFMSGYSSPGSYEGNRNTHRHMNRNR